MAIIKNYSFGLEKAFLQHLNLLENNNGAGRGFQVISHRRPLTDTKDRLPFHVFRLRLGLIFS
jgi:hypothetical protein